MSTRQYLYCLTCGILFVGTDWTVIGHKNSKDDKVLTKPWLKRLPVWRFGEGLRLELSGARSMVGAAVGIALQENTAPTRPKLPHVYPAGRAIWDLGKRVFGWKQLGIHGEVGLESAVPLLFCPLVFHGRRGVTRHAHHRLQCACWHRLHGCCLLVCYVCAWVRDHPPTLFLIKPSIFHLHSSLLIRPLGVATMVVRA